MHFISLHGKSYRATTADKMPEIVNLRYLHALYRSHFETSVTWKISDAPASTAFASLRECTMARDGLK